MASGAYQFGVSKIHDGTIDIDTSTLKLMLIKPGYTFQPDDQKVDIPATAVDLLGNEIVATGYTGGWGGSGRKTVTVTLQTNDTNNRVEIAIADLTWSALGGATNDTIGGAALVKEGGSDDGGSIPIYFFDTTDVPTNGGNITLDFATLAAGGNVQVNCG